MFSKHLDAVHKLTDTIKNIDKICMLENDGHSFGDGDWEARGRYSGRGSGYRDDGSSYANRRGTHYVRGHYSHESGNVPKNRYSRDDTKEYMMEQLENMMENADNTKVREALQRCMNTMENI